LPLGTGVAFSPEGTRLASVSDDKTLQLWTLGPKRDVWAVGEPGDHLAVCADETRVASASLSGTVKVWEVVSRKEIFNSKVPPNLEIKTFSPDGNLLAAAPRTKGGFGKGAGEEAVVHVFDVRTGNETRNLLYE
jgi:WD40 repeat protein